MIEDDQSFPVEHFAVPHHYKDSVSEILIPRGLVLDRYAAAAAGDGGAPMVVLAAATLGVFLRDYRVIDSWWGSSIGPQYKQDQ